MAKKPTTKELQSEEEIPQPKVNPAVARFEKELREIAGKLKEAKNNGTPGDVSALLKRQAWLLEQRDNEL